MSIAKVKEYLRDYGRDCDVQEFPVSSATVELAAKALSVEPARIAKTLSFHGDETNGCILIVSMQRFPSVYPAAGSASSAIELTCEELFKYSQAKEWIDVCKAKDVQAI